MGLWYTDNDSEHFNLCAQTFPHRRQLRLAIVHLTKIMFAAARANGDKIFRTIVFVPIGAGRMTEGKRQRGVDF